MKTQLINGHFSTQEALTILTQMIHVKITFQESKISGSANEEDIKAREKRIKDLQRNLYEMRQYIEHHGSDGIRIQADILLSSGKPLAV